MLDGKGSLLVTFSKKASVDFVLQATRPLEKTSPFVKKEE